MGPALWSQSFLGFTLQDGWQTVVSGLVAFFRLWHQHSQLHCLGKYLYEVSVLTVAMNPNLCFSPFCSVVCLLGSYTLMPACLLLLPVLLCLLLPVVLLV